MSQTNRFSVTLTRDEPATYLSDSTLVSFAQDCARIHLPQADDFACLQVIQKAARKLNSMNIKSLELQGEDWDEQRLWAFHQGYYSPKQNNVFSKPQLSQEQLAAYETKARIGDWVRATINSSADELSPEVLCQRAGDLIKQEVKLAGLASSVLSQSLIRGEELKQQEWNGVYQVGKGSDLAPAMLLLDFNPSENPEQEVALALVAKGITFDSGGYSLKPSDGMSVMKSDMGGAATLSGALALAISQGLQQRVILILCCAENMVSGKALKLGDIIQYKNGISVEVLNSDAEGRLVMADGLLWANEFKPKYILDAATLTGSAKMALGRDYHAVLAYNQELAQSMLSCAQAENELAWPLPLAPWHAQSLNSAFADIANIHSGEGIPGASTAAAFLGKFVEGDKQNWLHMDLSASYQKNANELWAAGAKGHGVATIAHFIQHITHN